MFWFFAYFIGGMITCCIVSLMVGLKVYREHPDAYRANQARLFEDIMEHECIDNIELKYGLLLVFALWPLFLAGILLCQMFALCCKAVINLIIKVD